MPPAPRTHVLPHKQSRPGDDGLTSSLNRNCFSPDTEIQGQSGTPQTGAASCPGGLLSPGLWALRSRRGNHPVSWEGSHLGNDPWSWGPEKGPFQNQEPPGRLRGASTMCFCGWRWGVAGTHLLYSCDLWGGHRCQMPSADGQTSAAEVPQLSGASTPGACVCR